MIIEPGVYDIPAADYHADPVEGGSLSSTGARTLMASCPALFRYEQDNPRPPKRAFDLGTAAHIAVLGVGPELVVIDAPDYRTKAAQAKRDEAYDAGKVPLLAHEHLQVLGMAVALFEHPVAAALFDSERGRPEQTLVWCDPATGVWRRALIDFLPEDTKPFRMIVPDYKTCKNAHPDAIQRAIHDYRYHQQATWYLDGVQALGLADEVAFVFVFQEKTPPYLVTVAEPDVVALRKGRDDNREALELFAECTATNHWPGYSDDIELITLPPWVETRYLQETAL